MRNPFTARRPWATLLVALLLGPFIAMLYIGRGRLAGLYFLLVIASIAAFVMLYPTGFGDLDYKDAVGLAELPIRLIGSIHAAYLSWKDPARQPFAWYSRWYSVLAIPVFWIALVFANQHLLFPLYYVPSHGMLPNIGENDAILGSRRAYDFRQPSSGDVVTLYRDHRRVVYVKRIIAAPGDRVQMRQGIIILNGKPVRREIVSYQALLFRECISGGRCYLVQLDPNAPRPYDDMPEITIPAGYYFLLGDNRDNSLDSRLPQFGLIGRGDIIGPVVVKFFDGETRRFVWRPVR